MRATIYLSVHQDLIYSKIAGLVRAYIVECFGERNSKNQIKFEPDIRSSRDFVHSSELDRFNALHDSHVIVVLPSGDAVDERQKFELKCWKALIDKYGGHPIYVILKQGGDYKVLQAKLIEGRLREVDKLKTIQNPPHTAE